MSRKNRALRAASVAARASAAAEPPTGSPAGSGRRGKRRFVRNDAIDATPPNILSIFNHSATTGDTSRQIQLYKDSRSLDSRLNELCCKRASAPAGYDMIFRAPPGHEDDPIALDNAKMLSRVWNNTEDTSDALTHLNHAPLESAAFLAQRWIIDPDTGWHRPVFMINDSHSTQIAWNIDTMEPWFSATPGTAITKDTKPSETCFPFSSKPDAFIFYSPLAGRADDPWHRGAMRPCIVRSGLKRFAITSWITVIERHGQPQLVAVIDYDALNAATPEEAAEVEEQVNAFLNSMTLDWRGQVPKGVEIVQIPITLVEGLQSNFIEWAQTEDSIAILGQNLTTESSGSGHAGVVGHSRVEHKILEMDARGLAEVITDRWAKAVIRYNRPNTPVPYAAFVTSPKQVVSVADYQAGAYTTDEFRISRGDEPLPDGKGARFWAPPVTGGSGLVGTPPAAESSKPSDTGEPGPSKPEVSTPGLTSMPAATTEAPDDAPTTPPEGKAADTALTGIQGERLEAIVLNVKNGIYPAEVGKLLISGTFPALDPVYVDALMAAVTAAGITPIAAPPPPVNPSAAT